MDVDVDGTSKTITNIQKKLDTGVCTRRTCFVRKANETSMSSSEKKITLEWYAAYHHNKLLNRKLLILKRSLRSCYFIV